MSFVRLVSTEVRRFEARRAMRWLVGLALLVALVVNVVQLARSDVGTTKGTGVTINAEGEIVPVREDRRVQVAKTFEDTVRGLGIALVLFGVLLGSTFMAAEFGSAGLSTQLLFEPRRVRLYAAKALGVFIGAAVSALLIVAWCGLLQLVASATRGSTDGVDGGWLVSRSADASRVALACGLAAVCALAIGAVARRTVVAVGVFFGLVVATGFLANVSWGKPIARVSPMNTLFGVGFGDLHDPDAFIGLRTLEGAVVISLAWAAGLSLFAAWWFARREVR